jgi:hypothetical protein
MSFLASLISYVIARCSGWLGPGFNWLIPWLPRDSVVKKVIHQDGAFDSVVLAHLVGKW